MTTAEYARALRELLERPAVSVEERVQELLVLRETDIRELTGFMVTTHQGLQELHQRLDLYGDFVAAAVAGLEERMTRG